MLQVLRASALVALLSLGSPIASSAQAQSDDERVARQLFDDGSSAYADGDYEHALASFERSYELSKRPALLYNVGMVLDRLRRDQAAVDAYEGYLRAVPGAENRMAVERRLVLLRQSLNQSGTKHRVATPQQVAQHELDASSSPPAAPASDSNSPRLYRKWWLWTSIAVVGAAIGVGFAVARTRGDDPGAAPANVIPL